MNILEVTEGTNDVLFGDIFRRYSSYYLNVFPCISLQFYARFQLSIVAPVHISLDIRSYAVYKLSNSVESTRYHFFPLRMFLSVEMRVEQSESSCKNRRGTLSADEGNT